MNNEVKQELGRRELARRHYRYYLPYVHGKYWTDTKMASYIADKMEEFILKDTGNAYDILMIQTPPQHGKSMTVTETLPSWYLGRFPDNQVIIASYDSDYAEKFCRSNKEKIKNYGRNLFHIGIGDVDRAQEFLLDNAKGRLISRGIKSGITGNPANLIIIDDPVKNRQEADSDTYRNMVWAEWQSSMKSRLCAGGKVIVIMTPWHEDDFAARLLASEPNIQLIRLPVEAEENDPLGRAPGDALCPELGKDNLWLKNFKESYIHDPRSGQRSWSALFLCSPRTEGGNIIRRDWWQYFDITEKPEFEQEFLSVDASFKGGQENDFVSIQVWGKAGIDYYLLYCLNQHLDFPQTLSAMKTVSKMFPRAHYALVEDKANGPAIMSVMRQTFPCLKVEPEGSKVSRVYAISAAIESGHVYLPDPSLAPWVSEFIEQFTAFPNGRNDDMVDAASQAIAHMLEMQGGGRTERKEMKGLWNFLRKSQIF